MDSVGGNSNFQVVPMFFFTRGPVDSKMGGPGVQLFKLFIAFSHRSIWGDYTSGIN